MTDSLLNAARSDESLSNQSSSGLDSSSLGAEVTYSYNNPNINMNQDQIMDNDEDDELIDPAAFQLTMRTLISTKEAGAIIGKGGKNIADIHYTAGIRAVVSKPIAGIPDRVMTMEGSLEGVARGFRIVAETLLRVVESLKPVESAEISQQNITYSTVFGWNRAVLMAPTPPGTAVVRLLIPHRQMGSIIGKQGQKIKSIQESCTVRMAASKDMLPQSAERIMEIQGTPDTIEQAVIEVGKCLYHDRAHSHKSIPLYISENNSGFSPSSDNISSAGSQDQEPDETINYAVPADLVGCLIGRAGAKIQSIRRSSGIKVSLAKEACNEAGDRLFTITGNSQARQHVLTWLQQQLEAEKLRKSSRRSNDPDSSG